MANALIIVDVQNDFVEGGSLAVSGGTNLAERLADFLKDNHSNYDIIVTTQDWHINPEGHFSDTPNFVDTWPVHCVAKTKGAEIVAPLAERIGELYVNQDIDYVRVVKGEYTAAYSGFEGTLFGDRDSLTNDLRVAGVTEVDICGIATDHCVRATAFDAVNEGFTATVLKDYCVGIDATTVTELFATGFAEAGIEVK